MQCFQKDPNLRVSAKKLLKHPWIVNARRSDSVVPKKSTEYEEAVRSVQEWNEALRSPDAGTQRKPLRYDEHSVVALRPDLPPSRNTPTKDTLPSPISKNMADRGEDNWDDDFATAISPSALHLPQLRPHDNFGGMLSSEKLKSFASLDGTLKSNGFDDSSQGTLQPGEPDPLQTIRPYPARKTTADPFQDLPRHQPTMDPTATMQNVPILTPNPVPRRRQPHPASFYKENSDEDYSDLIIANDDVLDRKISAFQVSTVLIVYMPV
jgi:serine/threonine protein kinase